MRKKIWILNHYATNMYFDQAGRHYWFSEFLLKEGYKPTIFCASTNHFSDQHIDTKKLHYLTKTTAHIPFVFVDTPLYQGNGKSRIMNMLAFYKGVKKSAKDYAKVNGKPDVILASSVHPLTLIAGIKLAKKFDVPCICEVRDLWPESIVAYGMLKRQSIVAKLLYRAEKWIYKKADAIIMTWEGGQQYIKDQGWDKVINLEKVTHISNGVIIDSFDHNVKNHPALDQDLIDVHYKNIVYTGSIRKINQLDFLLDTAKIIQKRDTSIRFLIYGSGDEKKRLEQRCMDEKITNVLFKGRVDKHHVPGILTRAYANILHNSSSSLNRYGQSQNKLFEYLAAGKCIIQTYPTGYSVIDRYSCGEILERQESALLADRIIHLANDEQTVKVMGRNAREAAFNFDFRLLTQKLTKIIETLT